MNIIKADQTHIEKLALMNKQLIEDGRHPNQMNVEQLATRMSEWLKDNYTCYIVNEDDTIVAYCLFRNDCEYYYMRQLFVDRN